MTTTSGVKIFKMLAMLADQCGEKVSPERLEFMMAKLTGGGNIDRILAALEGLLETARRFPTIGEIKAAAGLGAVSNEDKGREVAERIFAGLSKFGDMNGPSGIEKWDKQIAPYLGPIGIEVVKMNGGWNYLCETVTTKDATTWKAQWRGLAETLARKGGLGDAPTFDSLPPNDAIKALAEKAAF